jgi:hypothetical protein
MEHTLHAAPAHSTQQTAIYILFPLNFLGVRGLAMAMVFMENGVVRAPVPMLHTAGFAFESESRKVSKEKKH